MRFRNTRSRLAATALLLTGVAAPAAAQDFAAMDMTGMGIYAMEDSVMDAARGSVSSNRRGSGRARVAPAPAVRLTYKPSLERRRANFAQFIEKTRKKNPQAAADLQKELSSDVIEKIGGAIGQFGMRADNVADAYAIWWLNAWLASRQRNDTPPARQIAAVRAQAARAMASVPEMASASDAVKQEMAEANLIQAALLGSMMDDAEGNPTKLRQLAAAVRKGARASGLNLDAMDLTDDGFVPGGVGAAEGTSEEQVAAAPEVPPTAEPTAQVAAARNEGEDNTVIYAVAAAAAAGLAGGAWLARSRKSAAERQG
ncbi:DUF6683 family protein [Sphingomonas sp. HF-S4]|uniref:DUF6683 family protein n=1 Tax=Sphingomonas agrestis TaxID=3080540 RepID=A0ABU3Y721_9SPHN|nr:DUF6683 family protein [Sphingomonas sp. HF-S4]MDV3457228.1 DUF6683 family protein [Sphingomonas sp. HF-S4]